MGYYSSLDYIPFKTKLKREDFFKVLEDHKKSLPQDVLSDFWYDFEITPGKRVIISDDDLYAKHYADKALADFFSKVIAPGEHTSLTFEGEDGARWGYAIRKGEVIELDYPEPLAKGIPLSIFVANAQPKTKKLKLQYYVRDEFILKDIRGDLVFEPDARFVQVIKTASRLIRQSNGLLQYIDIPGYYFWEDLEFDGEPLRVEAPVCRVFVTSFMFRAYIRHTDVEIETEEVPFDALDQSRKKF